VGDGVAARWSRRLRLRPQSGLFIQRPSNQSQSRVGGEIRFALLYDELAHPFTCRVSPGIGVLYCYPVVLSAFFIVWELFSSRIQDIVMSQFERIAGYYFSENSISCHPNIYLILY